MSAYDEVIRKLKLQSVTEEELSEFEAQKTSTTAIPPLKENETRITKLYMSADVQASKRASNSPDEVFTVDRSNCTS